MVTTADGKEFKASMTKWAQAAGVKLDALARQSCQELSQRVVIDRPVDTGYLRGSWQPSLNEQKTVEQANLDKAGGYAISQASLTLTGMVAGDTYYMLNNAVYARRMEYGFVGKDSLGRSYNQAGRFFITQNVKRWRSIVTKTAKSLSLA